MLVYHHMKRNAIYKSYYDFLDFALNAAQKDFRRSTRLYFYNLDICLLNLLDTRSESQPFAYI